MPEPCKLTNRIRILRFSQSGMTQRDLAEKVGVTRQTIIAIEKSKHSPSLELAFDIAAALNTSITEVFSHGQHESHTAGIRWHPHQKDPADKHPRTPYPLALKDHLL